MTSTGFGDRPVGFKGWVYQHRDNTRLVLGSDGWCYAPADFAALMREQDRELLDWIDRPC